MAGVAAAASGSEAFFFSRLPKMLQVMSVFFGHMNK